jgi:hypothetical protein
MFAAPILIDRSMTNYSAGVSGNGNRIKSKMAAKYRDKRTSITTVRDQYPSYDIFPTHLIFHYPLPLMETVLTETVCYVRTLQLSELISAHKDGQPADPSQRAMTYEI